MENKWSKEWPTTEGSYWFYGFAFNNDKNPSLNYVKFLKVSNGIIVIREGTFWSKTEAGEGLFKKIPVPDISTIPWKGNKK